MKSNIFSIITIAALILSLVVYGCEEDAIGPPVGITSLSVPAAFGGDPVTIEGSNFQTVKSVFVGEKNAEMTSASETSISFIVPKNATVGANSITLVMPKRYRVSTSFEVLLRPVPEIFAISPSGADVGEKVTVVGLNLASLVSATLGGISVDVVSSTNTELIFNVPGGLAPNTPAVIELSSEDVTTASTSIFYVGHNNIANSDLEAGSGDDFDSWDKLNGGDMMTEVTGADAYFGRSIRIVGANNPDQPWRTQFASLLTPLNFNSEYTILLWAKGEAPGALISPSVSQFDGNGADYFYGDPLEITTEWAQYSWTFTVDNDLETHRVVLDMGRTDIPFLLDNITLIETGAAGPGAAKDLLADGGFENGIYPSDTPDGVASWQVLNGTIEVTTNANEIHCNDQAIKVTGAGNNPWDTQLAADVIPLNFEGVYELKLWAKAAGPGGVMRVSASRYNGGNGDDYFYGADIAIAEEWTEYSWTFTVGKDIPDGHHILLDMGASSQVFYIDDVSVKEYIAPTNILPDGGFESGVYPADTPDGVASWQLLNGTIEVTTNTEEVFDGSQALKITSAGGNPWDTQLAADVVPLTFEGRYGIKLMAKAASADPTFFRISASRYNGGNGDDYFYGANDTITQDWAEYKWEFTVGKDIPDGHHMVLDMGESGQVFYIDDVVLYEIPAFECK